MSEEENSFEARQWIQVHCRGADQLHPRTLDAVVNFALMWNLFEGSVCGHAANVPTFKRLAAALASQTLHQADIDGPLGFFSTRYVSERALRPRFDGLRFRSRDHLAHVEAVLLGKRQDQEGQILALLMIVYRLRNNLFHGMKRIDMLNRQRETLDMGCRVLATLMQAHSGYLMLKAP